MVVYFVLISRSWDLVILYTGHELSDVIYEDDSLKAVSRHDFGICFRSFQYSSIKLYDVCNSLHCGP